MEQDNSDSRRDDRGPDGSSHSTREKGLRGRISRRQMLATSMAGAAALGLESEADAQALSTAARADFGPEDVSLLITVMRASPHLMFAAAALKLCRALRLRYPLNDHAPLLKMFRRFRGNVVLAGHEIHLEAVTKFLPAAYFPIQTEDDFVCKLLMAVQRGELHHAHERALSGSMQAAETALGAWSIPAPTMNLGDPVPFD